jgi:ketosteroid isomerase-like protein
VAGAAVGEADVPVPRRRRRRGVLAGVAATLLVQSLVRRLLLARLRAAVRALNAGDYQPMLDAYAEDAVLHFNDGPHRWAGEHRGRAGIERFLQMFVDAGLQGELGSLWIGGPPWAATAVLRFDDAARSPEGELLYANRVAIVLRTRWGRVVEQEDFYEDTQRIVELERALTRRGAADRAPAAAR